MWDKILQPWPWYVAGPLIGLMVPTLLLLAGRTFGLSSSFRHIGAICLPKTKVPYIKNNNWRDSIWQLLMVGGVAIGGFIANYLLSTEPVAFLPDHYYSGGGVIKLIIGGILVGFGTRYANGCTSGHSIMGLANLRWPSLVATIGFFIGGIFTTVVFGAWVTGG
ncbi:MAG: YeeE/YedE family protein [Chloroflexi bacterium]|nr:YeeE/YedE family protein [Chloroflexota bacterium]